LFLFMAQVTLAMSFHLRNILLDRSAVRWRHNQVCPFLTFLLRSYSADLKQYPKVVPMTSFFHRVLSISITAFGFTAISFAAYILAFGLVRAAVLPILFQVPLVSHLLRPFLGHFIRGRWSLVYLWRNRALAWHSFFLGLTTIWGWEFAESLFDDKVQEVRVIICMTRSVLKTISIALDGRVSHR
jgi:nucleoporin NDC1